MRKNIIWFFSLFVVLNSNNVTAQEKKRPNIVVIMCDDLGWNDVSYHGSNQILTPNIDVLALQGVNIDQYYTDAYGTPSRSAFLTGKYPLRTGTQGQSILSTEDYGIPRNNKLLPAYLKDLGYTTHLVGKWGLGKSRPQYLPTNRGFDFFFGFFGNAVDYYTFNSIEAWNNSAFYGLDFYDNLNPIENIRGHLTDVITDHATQVIRQHDNSVPLYLQISHSAPHAGGGLVNLQPPVEALDANGHIAHSARRLYASSVTSLDRSVGNVVKALAEKEILSSTVIIFLSDNGGATFGPTQNFGSNLPFRGYKATPWEGGLRSIATVWQADIVSDVWEGLFHVTDWLPTIVGIAGGNITDQIDGVNQWTEILDGSKSKRTGAIIAIDDINGWAAVREGKYKLIVGNISRDGSEYFGEDLLAFRHDPPSYKEVLVTCDAARVIRDNVGIDMDNETVFMKRNDSVVYQIDEVRDFELCVPTSTKGCLFNVIDDPLEAHDLWDPSNDTLRRMILKLRTAWSEMKPRTRIQDERSNPLYFNFIWSPWLTDDEPLPEQITTIPTFPLLVTKGELEYLVDINMDSFKDKMQDYIVNMGSSFVRSVSTLFNFKD